MGTASRIIAAPGHSIVRDEASGKVSYWQGEYHQSAADATGNGRPLEPAGIDGVYAACGPGGRVMALLRDEGPRTKSVVVIRPATL